MGESTVLNISSQPGTIHLNWEKHGKQTWKNWWCSALWTMNWCCLPSLRQCFTTFTRHHHSFFLAQAALSTAAKVWNAKRTPPGFVGGVDPGLATVAAGSCAGVRAFQSPDFDFDGYPLARHWLMVRVYLEDCWFQQTHRSVRHGKATIHPILQYSVCQNMQKYKLKFRWQ